MKIIRNVTEMSRYHLECSGPLGLVPTMGSLHMGHISLINQGAADNNSLVVSIFVNPTQFGPSEDLENYPSGIEADLALLEDLQVNVAFLPTNEDIYPTAFDTWVRVGNITNVLEGKSRPDHFVGVATVVTKLFNIIKPDRVYFGQKDAQQILVVKRLIEDLNLGIDLVTMPTVREPDGLAMSSRNTYLNPLDRDAASILFKAISLAREQYSNGQRDANGMRQSMRNLISSEPRASIDYISISDEQSLEELDKIGNTALLSLAVYIGQTRLIDNCILG